MENLNIGLIGRADHDNFGDSLMFAFYVHYLRKMNINVFLIEASDIFINRLLDLKLECRNLKLSEIHSLDKAIFIGGGYFGQPDLNTKSWLNNFKENAFFENITRTLIQNNIKYSILGVEVGPLDDLECQNIVKFILRNATSVIVRNKASKEYTDKKLNTKSIFLRDIVLKVTEDFSSELKIKPQQYDSSHLVIHGTGKFFKVNPVSKLLLKRIAQHVKLKGYQKVTVVFDQSTYPELVSEAEKFALKLGEQLKIKTDVARYSGIRELLTILMSCSHIITTKLHLGVVGLSYKKKVFCISNMPKNKRFYTELFDGCGLANLYKAIVIPSIIKKAKYVSGNKVPESEKLSSVKNVSQLEALLKSN